MELLKSKFTIALVIMILGVSYIYALDGTKQAAVQDNNITENA